MAIIEIPDYSDRSLDYGDIISQIIYDDKNMIVTLTDEDLINSPVNTSVVSYYKKSDQGYEKICQLKVPMSSSISSSSPSVSSNDETENWDEELDATFQLNLNQNQHYSVINWADELSYEEPTNIPNWALISGLDFDRHPKDTRENIDDFDKIHHQYVINWAEETMYDGPVDIPDWALIPGLDFDRDNCSRRPCSTREHIDDFDQTHHQYVINWAEEPVYDGPVDVPGWAFIPGFDYDNHMYSFSQHI